MTARDLSQYVLYAGFGALAVVLCMTVVGDYDVWWHARLGADVLEHGSLVLADAHSYTFGGKPQYNGEWLADVLFYLSLSAGSGFGLNLLKIGLVLGICLLLLGTFRNIRQHESVWLWAGLITLTLLLFALRFRLYPRPFLFSYLMFSAFLFVLARHEGQSGGRSTLLWLPLLELLWANLQKGAFFGPVLVGLFALSRLIERRLDRTIILAFLGVVAASGINPGGFETYGALWETVFGSGEQQSLILAVGEHQSLTPELLWGYGVRYTWAFQLMGAFALVQLVAFGGWRRSFDGLRCVAFVIPALFIVRLTSFFSLAAAGVAFLAIERLLCRLGARLEPRRTAINVALGVLLAVLAGWTSTSATYRFGNETKPDTFPEGALEFLDTEAIEGPLFNSYSFGGFVLWQAPHRRVFIDGRARQLYTPEFFAAYQKLLTSPEAWAAAETRWGFTHALLDYDPRSGSRHFPEHLKTNTGWALVYWDTQSSVYLKRTPEYAAVIARREFKATRPNNNDFRYLQKYRSPTELSALVQQIDREIAFAPDNQEPRLAKAFVLLNYGNERGRQVGAQELKRCLEMAPDLAIEHVAMASLHLEAGHEEDARQEVEDALALDPSDSGARGLRAQLDGEPPPAPAAMPPHHP